MSEFDFNQAWGNDDELEYLSGEVDLLSDEEPEVDEAGEDEVVQALLDGGLPGHDPLPEAFQGDGVPGWVLDLWRDAMTDRAKLHADGKTDADLRPMLDVASELLQDWVVASALELRVTVSGRSRHVHSDGEEACEGCGEVHPATDEMVTGDDDRIAVSFNGGYGPTMSRVLAGQTGGLGLIGSILAGDADLDDMPGELGRSRTARKLGQVVAACMTAVATGITESVDETEPSLDEDGARELALVMNDEREANGLEPWGIV